MSSTTTQTQTSSFTTKSTDSTFIPRGPVTASLNFFKDPEDGSKPHNYVETPPAGQPQRNFTQNEVSLTLNDIRNRESDFHLDKDAFQAIKTSPSAETSFTDDEHIKSVYYPEIEQLILDHVPGSHKVTIFDHTIRRSDPDAPRAPVTRVHVDQTARSTEWRVRLHDPEQAEELLKGRFLIIKVWRPLNGPEQAHPMAVGSA